MVAQLGTTIRHVGTAGSNRVEPPTGPSLPGRLSHARSANGLAAKASESRRTIPGSRRGHLENSQFAEGIGLFRVPAMGLRLSPGRDPDSPRNRRERRPRDGRFTHESTLAAGPDGKRTSDQRVEGSNLSGRASSWLRFASTVRFSPLTRCVKPPVMRVRFPHGLSVESDARDLSLAESYAHGLRSQMRGNGPYPAPRSARGQGRDDASRRSHH
jgi:hypothetical protein